MTCSAVTLTRDSQPQLVPFQWQEIHYLRRETTPILNNSNSLTNKVFFLTSLLTPLPAYFCSLFLKPLQRTVSSYRFPSHLLLQPTASSVSSMLKSTIFLSMHVCGLYIKNQHLMKNLKLKKYILSMKIMLGKSQNVLVFLFVLFVCLFIILTVSSGVGEHAYFLV